MAKQHDDEFGEFVSTQKDDEFEEFIPTTPLKKKEQPVPSLISPLKSETTPLPYAPLKETPKTNPQGQPVKIPELRGMPKIVPPKPIDLSSVKGVDPEMLKQQLTLKLNESIAAKKQAQAALQEKMVQHDSMEDSPEKELLKLDIDNSAKDIEIKNNAILEASRVKDAIKKPNNLGQELIGSLESGSAQLGSSLAKTPGFVFDIFAIPQNIIAEYTGLPIGTSSTEAAQALNIPENKVAEYYDEVIKSHQNEIKAKYDKGVTDYLSNGEYAKGLGLLANQIVESAPISISLMAGNTAGISSVASTLGGGVVFGAQNKSELDKESSLGEVEKVSNALSKGLFEGMFEQFGITKLGGIAKGVLESEGKDVAKEVAKKSFMQAYMPIATKYLGNTAEEVVGEAATQFAQNAVDKYSGYKPTIDLMEGVSDAAIAGLGSSFVFSAPISGIETAKTYKVRNTAEEVLPSTSNNVNEQNKAIFNKVQEIKSDPEAEGHFKEKIDAEVETGAMTPEQADQVVNAIEAFKVLDAKIPENITGELRLSAVNIMAERDAIIALMEGKDESLLSPQKERVKTLNQALESISKGESVEQINQIINPKPQEDAIKKGDESQNNQQQYPGTIGQEQGEQTNRNDQENNVPQGETETGSSDSNVESGQVKEIAPITVSDVASKKLSELFKKEDRKADIENSVKSYNGLSLRDKKGPQGIAIMSEIQNGIKDLGYSLKARNDGNFSLLNEQGKEIRKDAVVRPRDEIQAEKDYKASVERAKSATPTSLYHGIAQLIASGEKFDIDEIKRLVGAKIFNEIPFGYLKNKGTRLEFIKEKLADMGLGDPDAYGEDYSLNEKQEIEQAISDFLVKGGRNEATNFILKEQQKSEGVAPEDYVQEEYTPQPKESNGINPFTGEPYKEAPFQSVADLSEKEKTATEIVRDILNDNPNATLEEVKTAIPKEWRSSVAANELFDKAYKAATTNVEVPKTIHRPLINRIRKGLQRVFGKSDSDVEILNNEAELMAKAKELGGGQFQIIGEKGASKLLNKEKVVSDLFIAKMMESENKTPKEIHLLTGWERGIDGKWKYEIPYAQYKDVDVVLDAILNNKKGIKITDIIDAKELFEAYPELKEVIINFDENLKDDEGANYNTKTKEITFNSKKFNDFYSKNDKSSIKKRTRDLRGLRGLLVHELQHSVQVEEGFEEGSNYAIAHAELISKYKKEIDSELEKRKNLSEKEQGIFTNSYIANKENAINIKEAVHKQYKNNFGEVEAGAASDRMRLSEEERKNTLISETIEKELSNNGRKTINEALSNDDVKFMKDPSGKVLGFTHNGNIYLNGEHLNSNTPIHEAGHIWTSWAEKNRPDLHRSGMDKVKKSKYLSDVENNKFYQDQAKQMGYQKGTPEYNAFMQNEALAKAIGDNGEQFVSAAKKADFKQWLAELWNSIAKYTGIQKLTGGQLATLSIDDFAKMVAADILEDVEIKKTKTESKPTEKQHRLGERVEDSDLPQDIKDALKAKGDTYISKSIEMTKAEANEIVNNYTQAGMIEDLEQFATNAISNIKPDVRVALMVSIAKKYAALASTELDPIKKQELTNKSVDIIYAGQKFGEQTARGLNAHKLWQEITGIDPSTAVAAVQKELDARNGVAIEKFADTIKDVKTLLDELLATDEGKARIEELAGKSQAKKKTIFNQTTQERKDRIKELKERIKSRPKTLSSSFIGMSKENIEDYTELGAQYIASGTINLAKWIQKMVEDGLTELQARELWKTAKMTDDVNGRTFSEFAEDIKSEKNKKKAENLKQKLGNLDELVNNPEKAIKDIENRKKIAEGRDAKPEEIAKLDSEIKEKKKLIEVLNKLEGVDDNKKRQILGESIASIVKNGYLGNIEFRNIFAKALGLEHITEQDAKNIKEFSSDIKNATDAGNVFVSNPTKENEAAFKKALRKAELSNDRLSEFFKKPKSLLSFLGTAIQGNLLGLNSLVGNIYANTIMIPFRFAKKGTASIFDYLGSKVAQIRGKEYQRSHDIIANMKGSLPGAWEGTKTGLRQLLTGALSSDIAARDLSSSIHPGEALVKFVKGLKGTEKKAFEKHFMDAAEGILGWAPEMMFRGLNLGDKPFRKASEQGNLREQAAIRGLKGDDLKKFMAMPPADVAELIDQLGKEATFQEDNFISTWLKGRQTPQNKLTADVIKFIATTQAPYIKTPVNIALETFEYAIPVIPLIKSIKYANDGDSRKALDSFGKFMVGASLAYAVKLLLQNGIVSGDEEKDPKKRTFMQLYDKPYMINIDALRRLRAGENPKWKDGDEKKDIRKMGIFGTVIMASIHVMDSKEGEDINNSMVENMLRMIPSTLKVSFESSFLAGTNMLLNAISSDEPYDLRKWITQTASTLGATVIPNTISSISKAEDDYSRDTRDIDLGQNIINIYKTKFFKGEDLPTRVNLWGSPIKNVPEGRNAYIYYLVDVTKGEKVDRRQFGVQLLDLYNKTHDPDVIPSGTKRTITIDNKTIKLTPVEYNQLATYQGLARRKKVQSLINSWNSSTPDETKIKQLKEAYSEANKAGTKEFYNKTGFLIRNKEK